MASNNSAMGAACDEAQAMLAKRIPGIVGFVVVSMEKVSPENTRMFVDWRTKMTDADQFLDVVVHLAESSKDDGEPWVKS